MKKEILKALEDGTIYTFISENYSILDKEELKELLLETFAALFVAGLTEEEYKLNLSVIKEQLKERWED